MPNNGYQAKEWQPGNVITATALNDMEHGITDVVLVQETDPVEDNTIYNSGQYNKIWINPDIRAVEIPTFDDFNEIKHIIVPESDGENISFWTLGNLSSTTGLPISQEQPLTAYTDYIVYPKEKYGCLFLYLTIEYQGFIYCYDKDKNFISNRISFTNTKGYYVLNDNTYYIRLSARHIGDPAQNEVPDFNEELAKTGITIKYITTSTITANSALGNMVKTGATYLKKAYDGEILYETTRLGIYENDVHCASPYSNKFHIICNSFVNSCLKGTTFEKSRYTTGNNGSNYEADWAWISDGTGFDNNGSYHINTANGIEKSSYLYAYDYLTSNELAHYAYNHKSLHEVKDCRDPSSDTPQPDPVLSVTWKNDIRPGDIIFSGNAFDERNLFLGIDHCAVVVNSCSKTLQNGQRVYNINVMEAYAMSDSSPTGVRFRRNLRSVEKYQISSWSYYTTFPVKNTAYTTHKTHIPLIVNIPNGSANKIFDKEYTVTLPPGVYTFIIHRTFNEYDQSGKNGYLLIRVFNEDNSTGIPYVCCEGEDKAEITFYSNKEFTWQLEKGDTSSEGYPTGINITGIDIYENTPPVLIEGPRTSLLEIEENNEVSGS